MKGYGIADVMPVIGDPKDFDPKTGTLAERIIFNNRGLIAFLCLIASVVFGYFATTLELNASFEKTIPTGHEYIKNYMEHEEDLVGLGNIVNLVVEYTGESIYDADYLDVLQKIHDEVFLIPGVDRMKMRSLWHPGVEYMEITEFGFDKGSVIGRDYDGSPEAVFEVRRKTAISGIVGSLVALNHKSSLVSLPLLSMDPDTGAPLDYGELGRALEGIRTKYRSDRIEIHIVGFGKVMGDMIAGVRQVMFFFLVAMVIVTVVLYWFFRCPRGTFTVVMCSVVAVIWQLGISAALGKDLNPYSVLVPFLVFSIAMSHGAQKMNGILQDVGRGTHKLIAARYTFRRLFLAGFTALVSDTFGFAVLMFIPIVAIRELALIAAIGVAVVVFTNLILVPVALSFVGVSRRAAMRSLAAEQAGRIDKKKSPIFAFLDLFTQKKWATVAVLLSIILAVGGWYVRKDIRIGDLDRGAPELHPDSRYNLDNDYFVENYRASSDLIAILVTTPWGSCSEYDTLMKVDALEWMLRQTEGVESTASLSLLNRGGSMLFSEGSLKWWDLMPNQSMLNANTVGGVMRGLARRGFDMLTMYVFLSDHKADTLTRVVSLVEEFAADNNTEEVKFLLGAGGAGFEAATNIVVEETNKKILIWVYVVVVLMCFITFRNWRAVVCAILPLMLTSILAEAVMAKMGIGVKVGTLPVIALGVGIGVDYALYILTVVLENIRAGSSLSEAFYRADLFTGKVVLLIGLTLSASVATWAWSPIKFQADMGLLLAFMFLVNMLGALILHPALAYFLYLRGERMK
jgi:predicted RND superfamily exporter protein